MWRNRINKLKNEHRNADIFLLKQMQLQKDQKSILLSFSMLKFTKANNNQPFSRQLSHLLKNEIVKSFKRQSEYWEITKAPGVSNLATELPKNKRGKGSQTLYRAIWLDWGWGKFSSREIYAVFQFQSLKKKYLLILQKTNLILENSIWKL